MRSSTRDGYLVSASFIFVLLLSAGCGSTNTPTQPTPSVISNSFTGTLGPQGRNTHTFTVQQAGGIDVTIIALSPDPTITVGIGLGAPSGPDCTLQLVNNAVHQASLLSASATAAGSYCVAIFDVGGIAEDATTDYTIQLSHF